MKYYLYIVLLLFTSATSSAQVAEPHMLSLDVIGGDRADGIGSPTSNTPEGGFIFILGTNSSSGSIVDSYCPSPPINRAVFVKYNTDGSVQEWYKCRQNSWPDTGYGYMFQTADDKYVLGGMANSGNSWVIRKEDALGNVLWIKAYGGSGSQQLYSMMPTNDGGYVFFGSAHGGDGDMGFHYGSNFTRDFWVLKLDANGDKVWSKIYGGTGEDVGASVLPAPDGEIYIIGTSNSTDYECTDNHGYGDVFVARLNADGDIIWHHSFGGSASDGGEGEGCRATLDGKGGILIAAKTGSADGNVSHKVNDPGLNFWLLSVDSNGDILWDNCYGGGGAEVPSSVCRATDGTIWMIGKSRNAGGQVNEAYGGNSDAYVVHTDSVGNFLNSKVLGSTGQDVGYMIHPLSNGLVIGGGYFSKGDGSFSNIHYGFSDAFLVKFTNWANEIKIVSLAEDISIYPNPATTTVNITSDKQEMSGVYITDAVGRKIFEGNFSNKLELSVNDWQSGLYYVQVTDADGRRAMKKLFVQ